MSWSASTTVLRTLPAPSSSTSTTSPRSSTPVPVGVPVRMTSPGSSVMKRERSAMRSAKEKMRLEETSSWTISPFTRVRSTSPCGSTSAAATAGPIGVKPSWPLENRLEPRSFQRKSAMPGVVGGGEPADVRERVLGRDAMRARADHRGDLALVPEQLGAAGADEVSVAGQRGRWLEEVGGYGRRAPALGRPAAVVQVDGDDLGGRQACWQGHRRDHIWFPITHQGEAP